MDFPENSDLFSWLSPFVHDFIRDDYFFPLRTCALFKNGIEVGDVCWTTKLLSPALWSFRGPWHRLITSVISTRPYQLPNEGEIYRSLAFLIAKYAAQKVESCRATDLSCEEQTTFFKPLAFECNQKLAWPALVLVVQLAFLLFDLSAFCRSLESKRWNLAPMEVPRTTDFVYYTFWMTMHRKDTVHVSHKSNRDQRYLTPADCEEKDSSHISLTNLFVVPIVQNIAAATSHASKVQILGNTIDSLRVLQDLLCVSAWYKPYPSLAHRYAKSLLRASYIFVRQLTTALDSFPGIDTINKNICSFLDERSWPSWAELGWDINMLKMCKRIGGDVKERDVKYVANLALRFMMTPAVDQYSTFKQLMETIDSIQHEDSVVNFLETCKPVLPRSVFANMVNFISTVTRFEDVYYNMTLARNFKIIDSSFVHRLITSYEHLAEELSTSRDMILAQYGMADATAAWVLFATFLSTYYHEATMGHSEMRRDIQRAVKRVLVDAAWNATKKRFSFLKPYRGKFLHSSLVRGQQPSPPPYQVLLHRLDCNDPFVAAASIMKWDVSYAMDLLDHASGISSSHIEAVKRGYGGIPLRYHRRIAIYGAMLPRHGDEKSRLLLAKLDLVFTHPLNAGGQFTPHAHSRLLEDIRKNNMCAQTVLGSILVSDRAPWPTARKQTGITEDYEHGIAFLQQSCDAGDREAIYILLYVRVLHRFAIPSKGWILDFLANAVQAEDYSSLFALANLVWEGAAGFTKSHECATKAMLFALQVSHEDSSRTLISNLLLQMPQPALTFYYLCRLANR